MTKEDMQKIIGHAIKEKRQEKKLTQKNVSKIINISRNYIADIENGRYMPSVNTLIKLAKLLNINLNALFLSSNDGNTSNKKEAV